MQMVFPDWPMLWVSSEVMPTILGWMPKASSRNIKARLQVSVMVLIFLSPKMITNCRVLFLFLAYWLSQPLRIFFGLS